MDTIKTAIQQAQTLLELLKNNSDVNKSQDIKDLNINQDKIKSTEK
jgi:hypothetical protein